MCPRGFAKSYKRRWKTMGIWTKTFSYIAVINYLCLTCFGLEPLCVAQNSVLGDPILISQTALFVLLFGFQVTQTIFGLFHENLYELSATMVTQMLITVIAMLKSFMESPSSWDLYTILFFMYGVAFQSIHFIFILPLHSEHNLSEKKILGGSGIMMVERKEILEKKRKQMQFQALLKLDLMASLANVLIFGSETTGLDWFIVFVMVCTGVSGIHFVVGQYGHIKEKVPLVLAFWVLCSALPVFVVFGVIRIIEKGILFQFEIVDTLLERQKQQISFYFLFCVSGCLLLMLRVLLVIQSVRLYQSFDQRIKLLAYLQDKEQELPSGSSEEDDMSQSSIQEIVSHIMRKNQSENKKPSNEKHLSGNLHEYISNQYE